MVAGNTKKVIMIKNVSSNLIEEVILILKSEPGAKAGNPSEKTVQSRQHSWNDFILREAEFIINQYIKENGLAKLEDRRGKDRTKPFRRFSRVDLIINISLVAAVVFLLLVILQVF